MRSTLASNLRRWISMAFRSLAELHRLCGDDLKVGVDAALVAVGKKLHLIVAATGGWIYRDYRNKVTLSARDTVVLTGLAASAKGLS
jgi:hypothetical protein